MQLVTPIVQDLVLIGGGHSHAIVLKLFGMNPLPGVRMTLITDVCDTPYSGMLPGYVAGLYEFDDCHIDLRPLCLSAGAIMIVDRAIGLDLQRQYVLCAHHPPIAFDWLSIDIGSTPATLNIPGASKHAIPVKPISRFLSYWDDVVKTVIQAPHQPMRLSVVGGGVGGVELTLAIQARLRNIYKAALQPATHLQMHLFQRDVRLAPSRHPGVGRRLHQILSQTGVQIHLQESVSALTQSASPLKSDSEIQIICESGLTVGCDRVFWVTQASAAAWLAASELATDAQGFIQVSDTLQSLSHPQVFAAGDVATLVNHPRPKAGVFAVRQGKPLYENLRRVLLGQSPEPFTPQKEFLILVGTGDRSALASRGNFTLGPYPWLWSWKHSIDWQFMLKFRHLQPMMKQFPLGQAAGRRLTLNPATWAIARAGKAAGGSSILSKPLPLSSAPLLPCAGCGSKVSSQVLQRVLQRLQQEPGLGWQREDILLGLDAADDAAIVSVPTGQVLVQTVDYFRALLNDPFVFGQIAAHHCLNDLFAMGAAPQSALAVATLPYAAAAKTEEILYHLLLGATKVLQQAGAVLVGGHTSEATELALGLMCNGLATPAELFRKTGLQAGQMLILTKPLGTGTLFAADMRLQAKGRWIQTAIQSMLHSNQQAVDCFRAHAAAACTDVTGFGLVGHLLEMRGLSPVTIELSLSALPILEGARETIQNGLLSSLHPQNLRAAKAIANLQQVAQHPLFPILFDPQTAGGLLAAVPANRAQDCLRSLQAIGYGCSRIIGQVLPGSENPFHLVINE